MMKLKRIGLFVSFILIAYFFAWGKVYFLSKSYFEFAQQQEQSGNYVVALKGTNKLEVRIDEVYLGGYQQVIEAWDNVTFGITPSFYDEALKAPERLILKLSDEELYQFVDLYVQLDSKYVPEVAELLLKRATDSNDELLASEMREFLIQAFPDYLYFQD
ncbi:hypothetical protein VIN01S_26540 [Vibrio inusitatus NBRC 102082]|uniref:Uncharacterized protein n=1 Tax=Vibrio inusitatus NBRC 102082 TaxID=1219070 RepID=A0A4Y3HYR7_9VIBR|nr:hypothetical protein [Vibrio inusitatus]GEA51850.1 hypothetical protein VIN01S_26540 [Vibrio inusitatus NBRC 102082]